MLAGRLECHLLFCVLYMQFFDVCATIISVLFILLVQGRDEIWRWVQSLFLTTVLCHLQLHLTPELFCFVCRLLYSVISLYPTRVTGTVIS